MNRFLFCSAFLLLGLAPLFAEPSIPDNLWEQHPEGIALAVTLTTQMEYGEQTTYVMAYTKNTSDTIKELLNQGPDLFAQFFYIDDHGKQISLGNHLHPDHPERDIVERNPSRLTLSPGETRWTGTDITSDEIVLIKTHPVICSVIVYDPATKQKITVKSSPKILVPGK